MSAHVRALTKAVPPAPYAPSADLLPTLRANLEKAAQHKQMLAEAAESRGGRSECVYGRGEGVACVCVFVCVSRVFACDCCISL